MSANRNPSNHTIRFARNTSESPIPNERVAQAVQIPTTGDGDSDSTTRLVIHLAPGLTAYLPDGVDLTQPRQVGADLHFLQPDGSVVIIEGGAISGLAIHIGDVLIPADTVALLLEDAGIDIGAGAGPGQQTGAHGNFEHLGPQSVGGSADSGFHMLGNTPSGQRSDIPPNGTPYVVNTPPTATADRYAATNDTRLTVGSPAGVLANDSDSDGNALSAVLVSDVSHGSLVLNTDGSFTYVPDETFTGTDSFTYRANDGSTNSNTVTVTIDVALANSAPVSEGETYGTAEDTALSISAAAGVLANDADAEGDALTATLVTDVAHGTLSLNPDGSFSYVSDENFTGTDSFTYRANDGNSDGNTVTVTIDVDADPPNSAPVSEGETYGTAEDAALSISAAAGVLANDADAEGDALTATLVTDADHGTLSLNADGSFSYAPDRDFSGRDSFSYTANDGRQDGNTVTVNIDVTAVNDAPVLHAPEGPFAIAEDGAFMFENGNAISFSDVDAGSVTVRVLLATSNGSLFLPEGSNYYSGQFSFESSIAVLNHLFKNAQFVPAPNFSGQASFVLTIDDLGLDGAGGALSDSRTFAFDVAPVTDIPMVFVSDAEGPGDASGIALSISAKASDTAGDSEVVTRISISGVENGTLSAGTDQGNGVWVLAPAQLENLTFIPAAGFTGTVTLSATATAQDGAAATADSATATFDITVLPDNEAPIAAPDAYSVNEDETLAVSVSAGVLSNDTDADSDALSATLVSDVSHGSLTLNADGSFTYSPNANFSGSDSFTYTAGDGTDASSATTVTIDVAPVVDGAVIEIVPVVQNRSVEYSVSEATFTNHNVPAVAALPDGRFVVVYMSYPDASSSFDVYARYLDSTGAPTGNGFKVNSAHDGSWEGLPYVAALSDGSFVAVYGDYLGQPVLYGTKVSSDGTQTAFTLDAALGSAYSRITALPDGGFVVVWEDGFGGNGSIRVAAYDNQLDLMLAGTALPKASTSLDERFPDVAVASNGATAISWIEIGEDSVATIYVGLVDLNDGSLIDGSPVACNDVPADATPPAGTEREEHQFLQSIIALADGGFAVSWVSEHAGSFDVYVQILDANLDPVGSNIRVNPENTAFADNADLRPLLAPLDDGGFMVTWHQGPLFRTPATDENLNPGDQIMAQRFDDVGNRIGPTLIVNATTPGRQYYPDVVQGDDGSLLIVWHSSQNGDASDPNGSAGQNSGIYGALLDLEKMSLSGEPQQLHISLALADTDGSEAVTSITISGYPPGASFSLGHEDGSTWIIDEADDIAALASGPLTMTPPADYTATFALSATANVTDSANLSSGVASDTTSTTETIDITITAVNDEPVAVDDVLSGLPTLSDTLTLTAGDGHLVSDPNVDANNLLAIDGRDGKTLVVYSSNGNTTVVGVYLDGDGNVLGQPISFAPTLSGIVGHSGRIGISLLENGNIFVQWQDGNSTNVVTKVALLSPDGQVLTEPYELGSVASTHRDNDFVQLADGSFAIATNVGTSHSDNAVKLFHLVIEDDNSFTVTEEASLNPSGVDSYAGIAANEDGNIALVWRSGGYISDWWGSNGYVQLFDANFSPISAIQQFNSEPGVISPRVTAMQDGSFSINWTRYTDWAPNWVDVAGRVISGDGQLQGAAEFLVNAATQGGQGIGIAGLAQWGGALLPYSVDPVATGYGAHSDADVALRFYDADASIFSNELIIDVGNGQRPAHAVSLDDGRVLLLYPDSSGDFGQLNGSGIVARIVEMDGWSPGTFADEDTPFNIASADLLANDHDPDGDALTISAVSATSSNGASIVLNDDGTITYDPSGAQTIQALAAGETIEDSFAYTVSDGNGGTDTATVTLTVSGVNDAPVAHDDSLEPAAVGEFLVNTIVDKSQVLPQVALLKGGQFIVVWQSTADSDDVELKAQLFDASGAEIGTEFFINETRSEIQNRPTVAALSDGGFVVAWHSTSSEDDPTGHGIMARIFAADGSASDPEFHVNTQTALQQDIPSIAALGTGGFVVAWQSNDGIDDSSLSGVKAQIYDADGEPLGTEFLVNTETLGEQWEPSVTGLANGKFVVTWWSYSGPENAEKDYAIKAQIFEADGQPFNGELPVNSTSEGHHENPIVTLLPDGRFIVVWHANDGQGDLNDYRILARFFEADGTPASSEIQVNTETAGLQNYAKVAVLSTGGFVVTWQSSDGQTDTDGFGIKAQIFDADGNRIGAEFLVNSETTNHQTRSNVSALSDGGFIIAWQSNDHIEDPSADGIKARLFNADGTDRGGYTENTPISIQSQALLANDSDPDGDALTISAVSATSSNGASVVLNGDGTITYDPSGAQTIQALAAGETIEDSFTYTISDGNGGTDTATVTLTVSGVNDAPVAVSESYSAFEDTPLSVTADVGVLANDSDIDGDALVAVLVNDVSHGSLMLNADGSFTYTPEGDFSGADEFTYNANDGTSDGNTISVAVNVDAVNDAPVMTAVGPSVDIIAGQFSRLDTDFHVTDAELDARNNGLGRYNGSTLYVGTGSDPAEQYGFDLDGASFTFDGAYLRLNGEIFAAIAVKSGSLQLNFSDPSPVDVTSALAHEVFHRITYAYIADDPPPTMPLRFVFSDGGSIGQGSGGTQIAEGTITVNITPSNAAPLSSDDAYSTSEDTPLSLTAAAGVLANDTDEDGDALSAVVVTDVSHGRLTLNADGSFSYTPEANFAGTDSFTYLADDGTAEGNTATVTIDVAPVADGASLSLTLAANHSGSDAIRVGPLSGTQERAGFIKVGELVGLFYTDTSGTPGTNGATDSSGSAIRIAYFNADGTPTGQDIVVNQATAGDQISSMKYYANAANGTAVLVWQTSNTASYARIIGSDGMPVTDEFQLPFASSYHHAVALDTGGFAFAYSANNFRDIAVMAVDANGAQVSPAYVASSGTYNEFVVKDIIALQGGAYMLVRENGGLEAQKFSADGTLDGTSFLVSTGTGDIGYFNDVESVALPDGRSLVVWSQHNADTGGKDIFGRFINSDGSLSSAEMAIAADSSGDQTTPIVGLTGDGMIAVVWREGTAIEARLLDQSGNFVTSDVGLNQIPITAPYWVDTITAMENGVAVTWHGNDGSGRGVSYRVLYSDGSVSGAEAFANVETSGDQTMSGLVTSNTGLVFFTWVDLPTGEVRMRTFDGLQGPIEGDDFGIVIDATLPDSDGSETITSIVLSGFPPGSDFSLGQADGTSWVIDDANQIASLASAPLTMTPPADYNGSFSLSVTTSVTDTAELSNGAASDVTATTETIAFTIAPVNDAPVAAADSFATNEDMPLTVDAAAGVLANDTDEDGDALSAVVVTDVSHGRLTLNADGSFSYSPDADFSGIDDFTYAANDGTTDGNSVTVTLDVAPVADEASITLGAGAAGSALNYTNVPEDFSRSIAQQVLLDDLGIAGETITVDFWMNWSGSFDAVPFAFDVFNLSFIDGSMSSSGYQHSGVAFGFNTGNGEIYGADVAGLAGNWVHIAAIFVSGSPETSRLFFDGSEQTLSHYGNAPIPSFAAAGDSAAIGGIRLHQQYSFQGALDDLHIWHGALSEAEIAAAMSGAIDFEDTTLVAAYSFEPDTISGNTLTDLSGNGHNGVMTLLNSANLVDGRAGDPSNLSGIEDVDLALPFISAVPTDADGSETVSSIVLTGFPAGAVFSTGSVDPSDSTRWIIDDPSEIAALASTRLTMTPPADYTGSFDLSVTANVSDSATLSSGNADATAIATETVEITIAPDPDAPGKGYQSLIGHAVSMSSVWTVAPEGVVAMDITASDGIELTASPNDDSTLGSVDLDLTANTFIIANSTAINLTFLGSEDGFVGLSIEDAYGLLAPFTSVTSNRADIPVAFTENQLVFNLAGAPLAAGESIVFSFTFSADPVVIDLNGDGIVFTPRSAFDLDGDGAPDTLAWPGPDDGLLGVDLDGSGRFENGTELLSPGFAGQSFADSFDALASLDENADGRITAEDSEFERLRVWTDTNSDGISDDGELTSLIELGIVQIDFGDGDVELEIDGQSAFAHGSTLLEDGSERDVFGIDLYLGNRPPELAGLSVESEASSITAFDADELIFAEAEIDAFASGITLAQSNFLQFEDTPASPLEAVEQVFHDSGNAMLGSGEELSANDLPVFLALVADDGFHAETLPI